MNKDYEKEKEEKQEKKEDCCIKTYTIKGPNLGDTKTIRIYPGGHIQIIDGGI